MKALCVAVVVLSFFSVGQPAPLVCDTLLKPTEKGPDLSGRWYYVALSEESCLTTTLLDSLVWPSGTLDVTSRDTPNLYDGIVTAKMHGFCFNESEPCFYDNNKIYAVNSDNDPTGEPDVLLHTSCQDCIVIKQNDFIDSLVLLSRRPTVTDVELKEFGKQADCLGWAKPQAFNTDHDYDNCQSIDVEEEAVYNNFFSKLIERLNNTKQNIITCLADMFISSVKASVSNI
ncbi:uncharacterized protein LOC108231492 isoform X2 [Kryptolebias marmoratus]|uniref:uncharacterized protein LOC108231492 isoform X2 n=1 Tax=Kryptolebias marmoratus TaxID=37003 RepID=UPI0007F8F960|nr:uncharacterized protein LOC108231492 isoform X2 [Kryptolebias marmoratus]